MAGVAPSVTNVASRQPSMFSSTSSAGRTYVPLRRVAIMRNVPVRTGATHDAGAEDVPVAAGRTIVVSPANSAKASSVAATDIVNLHRVVGSASHVFPRLYGIRHHGDSTNLYGVDQRASLQNAHRVTIGANGPRAPPARGGRQPRRHPRPGLTARTPPPPAGSRRAPRACALASPAHASGATHPTRSRPPDRPPDSTRRRSSRRS